MSVGEGGRGEPDRAPRMVGEGGLGSPHFVLLAMGDRPGAPDPWHLSRGGDCCTVAEARQAAADLVDAARREGFREVSPLLCALRLHNHTWH